MADYRIVRLLAKLEIPLLLAVPAVMAAALLAGVEQAALAMLVVVALVLALFFAGYEASRPGLRQIMPTLVLAALAAAGRILFGPIPDFKPVSAIAIIAGATLGRRNGFMVGALAALTSNFFWTGHVDAVADVCLGARGIRWRCAVVCGCIRPRRWHRAHAGATDLRLCFGFAVRRCDQRLRHYRFCSTTHVGGCHGASCHRRIVRYHARPCDLRVFGRPVQALVSPHQPSRREIRAVGLVTPGRESILPKRHFKTMPVYGARLAQADHAGYF